MVAADKIKKILMYLNINAKVFSEMLGYDRPQIIYDILTGKTQTISNKLTNKIISVFPEINRSWLLVDEGEMILPSAVVITGEKNINGSGNEIKNMTGNRINISIPERGKKKIINSEGIVIESSDENASQSELNTLKQALSDKDKIISLLEDKINMLTKKQ